MELGLAAREVKHEGVATLLKVDMLWYQFPDSMGQEKECIVRFEVWLLERYLRGSRRMCSERFRESRKQNITLTRGPLRLCQALLAHAEVDRLLTQIVHLMVLYGLRDDSTQPRAQT